MAITTLGEFKEYYIFKSNNEINFIGGESAGTNFQGSLIGL